MDLPQKTYLSIPEYLALEASTGIKHEYHDGVVTAMDDYQDGIITAMAGKNPEHARVSLRIGSTLENHLKGKPYKPFSPDLKIKAGGKILYPDLAVVCPPMRRDPELPDAVLNPRVVIEVLSESTANYDRSDKFGFYRQNAEMTDYVLVDPMRKYAEHYTRIEGDRWNLEFLGPDSVLRLTSIECEFPFSECYEGMEMLLDEQA